MARALAHGSRKVPAEREHRRRLSEYPDRLCTAVLAAEERNRSTLGSRLVGDGWDCRLPLREALWAANAGENVGIESHKGYAHAFTKTGRTPSTRATDRGRPP